jgi:integrase
MTVRKEDRSGKLRWVIDIPYQTADGKKQRYRRDAQIQTKFGADAEHRRLLAELARAGTLRHVPEPTDDKPEPKRATFADAARHFKKTRLPALKPSTRITYTERLNKMLLPRFGNTPLDELNGESLAKFDAELAKDELKPSSRRNYHIVFRSIMRVAVEAGLLEQAPKLPSMPKVGRKVTKPLRRADLDAILAVASPNARVAFALAAYAGLRAGEVRGLRWPDVDLKAGTLTIRRSITRGEEATPKSGHHAVLPITAPLRAHLEAAQATRKGPWDSVALTAVGKPWGESGLNQSFQRARDRAGLDTWSFHDLRHFFVSELLRRGAPVHVVQALARHSDLKTTQRYADLDANDLRAAINLLQVDENRENADASER